MSEFFKRIQILNKKKLCVCVCAGGGGGRGGVGARVSEVFTKNLNKKKMLLLFFVLFLLEYVKIQI